MCNAATSESSVSPSANRQAVSRSTAISRGSLLFRTLPYRFISVYGAVVVRGRLQYYFSIRLHQGKCSNLI